MTGERAAFVPPHPNQFSPRPRTSRRERSRPAGQARASDGGGGVSDGSGEHERSDEDGATADWQQLLDDAGELTPAAVEAILAAHGDRGSRAIDAVGEGRVKAYQDFPVVVGHSDEYIVEEGACTCKDATYNLDPEDPDALCWHALAVEIGRRIGAVDHQELYYSEVRDLL